MPSTLNYSGSNYVGVDGTTYTGSAQWLDPALCNGIVLSDQAAASTDFMGCPGTTIDKLRSLAALIGAQNGSGAANHVVAAYTAVQSPNAVAPGVQAQPTTPITLDLPEGRFVSASVWAAETNCNVGGSTRASLQFEWSPDGTTWAPLGLPVRVCNTTVNPTTVLRAFSGGGALTPAGGATTGFVRVSDLSGQGANGNDVAWDDFTVYDATPQLTKTFTPSTLDLAANPAAVSTLAFTVTNTDEYGEKVGWAFTDVLPEGLVVAPTPNVRVANGQYGQCAATVTGPGGLALTGGETAIEVNAGELELSSIPYVDRCTISVDVTGTRSGVFTNRVAPVVGETANVDSIWGVIPVGDAILTISGLATLDYDPNAGTCSSIPSQTVAVGDSVSVNDGVTCTRPGYQFVGWNEDSDGLGTAVDPSSLLTLNADSTLYAMWLQLPDASDDFASTPFGTAVTGSVSTNDLAPVDSTFSLSTNAANGTIVLSSTGSFAYTPNKGFTGVDSFVYELCLAAPYDSVCSSARFTIRVGPQAVNSAHTTRSNTPVKASVASNDIFPSDATFLLVTRPSNGLVTLSTSGAFTYIPRTEYAGTDKFRYRVCSPGTPSLCSTASVSILIQAQRLPLDVKWRNKDKPLPRTGATTVVASALTAEEGVLVTRVWCAPRNAVRGDFVYCTFNVSTSGAVTVRTLGLPGVRVTVWQQALPIPGSSMRASEPSVRTWSVR